MNNVNYNSKQNWVLNEIVMPEDVNKWEKGIADVVALANYLNSTDIPNLADILNNLQNNTANKDLSNISQNAAQKLIPVGAILPGPVTELEGFLLCNGQAVSRTTYAALYAKIGTNFGYGDDSTTFNVPDYRGCFLRGLGGNSAADMYTKQQSGVPNITGRTGSMTNLAAPANQPNSALHNEFISTLDQTMTNVINQSQFAVTIDARRSSSVYQEGLQEARPVNFAINYFIKF